MSSFRKIADRIPGLLSVALVFKGKTPAGQSVSLAALIDGDTEVILDLTQGFSSDDERLTQPMKSYLTGLAEVGTYLKARKTEDEDGVTEDQIERAALMLAFPKAAQNDGAMTLLKSHLDALQDEGIIDKIGGGEGEGSAPEEAKPADKPEETKQAAPARPARPVAAAAVVAAAPKVVEKVKETVAEVAETAEETVEEAEETVTETAQKAEAETEDKVVASTEAEDAISEVSPKEDDAGKEDEADVDMAAAAGAKEDGPRRGFFRS